MKPARTIIITALIFWLVQILLFVLLFATWFINIVMRLLVSLGLNVPPSAIEGFLSGILNDLSYPIRLFLPNHQLGDGFIAVALALSADSLIWGVAVGTLICLVCRAFWKGKAV